MSNESHDKETARDVEARLKGRGSDDSLEHKLAELSEEDFPLASDKKLLREWRDRVSHLHVIRDFIKHPAVAEFVKIGLERIADIDKMTKSRDLLLNPARHDELTALVVERDIHMLYLNFFDVNPDAELTGIESAVDSAMDEKEK